MIVWGLLASGGAEAGELDLGGPVRWVEEREISLGAAALTMRQGFVFPVRDTEAGAVGFVFVGDGRTSFPLEAPGEALGLAAALAADGLPPERAGRAVVDGAWSDPIDVALVLGRGDPHRDFLSSLPEVIDGGGDVVTIDASGRYNVIVTDYRPGRARARAVDALQNRVRRLTDSGLDPRRMIALDAHRDPSDPGWIAEVRADHSWRAVLEPANDSLHDRWLTLAHDPTGAIDDGHVDTVLVCGLAPGDVPKLRIVTGTRRESRWDEVRIAEGATNVVVAQASTGTALDVRIEALITVTAARPTALVSLALPREAPLVLDSLAAPAPAFALEAVETAEGEPLVSLGEPFGPWKPEGDWEMAVWKLPEPLAPGRSRVLRVVWRDRWASSHLLDVGAWALAEKNKRRAGPPQQTGTGSGLVELGRVADSRRVMPIALHQRGAYEAEIRVGTTLGERWRAGIGGASEEEARDSADGRWRIARTTSDARVSFGILTESTAPALGPFPAIRILKHDAWGEGSPAFVRAVLNFYDTVLPPYPFGALALVQGVSEPMLGDLSDLDDTSKPEVPQLASDGGEIVQPGFSTAPLAPARLLVRAPRVDAVPGQLVIRGIQEVSQSGLLERTQARIYPHAIERGIAEGIARHWWDLPSYARRDAWIGPAVSAFLRDRFVDEAWGEEIAGRWGEVRQGQLSDALRTARIAPLTYSRDPWAPEVGVGVLDALQARVGEQAMHLALARFLEAGVPTTEALEEAVSEAAGTDVGPMFDAWVVAGIRPELTGSYEVHRGRIAVELHSDLPWGRIPVPVGVVSRGETRIGWIELIDGQGAAELATRGRIEEVVIDPHGWLGIRGAHRLGAH